MTEVVDCSFRIECNAADADVVRKFTGFFVKEIQDVLDEQDLGGLVIGYRNESDWIPFIWREIENDD